MLLVMFVFYPQLHCRHAAMICYDIARYPKINPNFNFFSIIGHPLEDLFIIKIRISVIFIT